MNGKEEEEEEEKRKRADERADARAKMASVTEAEHVSHHWAHQTTIAISWTGGLAFFVALCSFIFQVLTHLEKKKEEKKKEEKKEERERRANTLDEARRQTNDDRDELRRQTANDEDDARREMGRRAEKRGIEAAERLEELIKVYRYVRFNGEPFLSHAALRLSSDPIGTSLPSRFSHNFCCKE